MQHLGFRVEVERSGSCGDAVDCRGVEDQDGLVEPSNHVISIERLQG